MKWVMSTNGDVMHRYLYQGAIIHVTDYQNYLRIYTITKFGVGVIFLLFLKGL